MRKKELNELLLRSLTEEVSEKDRELVETELLPDFSFNDDFRDNIMRRIKGSLEQWIKNRD